MDTILIVLLLVIGLVNSFELAVFWIIYDLIRKKQYKFYEIVKCECGHSCPIEFAVIDDDSNYTCPDCCIDELNSQIKELQEQIQTLQECL